MICRYLDCGDFLNLNLHLHAVVTDDCFLLDGSFVGIPGFHAEDLEETFQYEVLKMLKKEGGINDAVVENMLSRRHAGFNVHIGGRIWPEEETALENLAKYIVRASLSQERMLCIPAEKSADGSAKVVYQSKDGKTEQTKIKIGDRRRTAGRNRQFPMFFGLFPTFRKPFSIHRQYLPIPSPIRRPRGTIQKPDVASLTKNEFLSYSLDKSPLILAYVQNRNFRMKISFVAVDTLCHGRKATINIPTSSRKSVVDCIAPYRFPWRPGISSGYFAFLEKALRKTPPSVTGKNLIKLWTGTVLFFLIFSVGKGLGRRYWRSRSFFPY